MPTRSSRDEPARSVRELGLPGRAVTALTRAGVTSVDDLAALTRRDLAAISGLGPGMIAAIRLVVPEPPASSPRLEGSPADDRGRSPLPATDAGPGPDEEESPAATAIPSLDSLRAARRRSAVDLLVPGASPSGSSPSGSSPSGSSPSGSSPSGSPPSGSSPSAPSSTRPRAAASPTGTTPRPAEYADLLRLALYLGRTLVAVPVRLVRWSFREPVRLLRRPLGG
ncbi:DNA-directed RNA polymerase subunit alpha C-terminal domain-containing protein [Blastococcus deserti]|uniref:DNA-directed RNA polymerase subunit alpha C-terminal domain-containing protein n=1 Tax=Blastococcus deserti TaxID=2259033 RepID=A0ABW4X7L7_9ACTN